MVGGILARYLARSVTQSVVLGAIVLTGLYLSVDLVREAGDMRADYGFPEVALFLLRTIPARLYDLFPFAVLIGGVIALGRLSAGSELVAMRAGGFQRQRILGHVLAPALLLGLCVMLAGELLAPRLEMNARIDRERARDGQVGGDPGQSLWVRDGRMMIRAGIVLWNDDDRVGFGDLSIYMLDGANRIERVLQAVSGRHEGGRWKFREVGELDTGTEVAGRSVAALELSSELDPGVFRALVTRPRLLPMADILRIRSYLEANGQDSTAYRQAFWRRLLYPLNMLMMLFSGVAFLLRYGRLLTPALGIFTGVSLGIGFFVLHRLVLGMAPVLPMPLGVTHLMPAALFGLLGLFFLRR
ncbi:MAG: LPS export ABC transporter permease LptG [Wenzhouxiangellaceae bacterium]|jgi:lipopolysaccharide export system permease protein|nr:LPS export ABC transporter permease LptG [Wenzhouxiangellaceae bacterium]MBS3745838.1 LPS export ABC transporter permease LptG [Wenzhouxiangellaceae bacterium]MBS3824261.1 LPS export ABC transporter permease LptG [Wenzhouxiangellaceae bacterium]